MPQLQGLALVTGRGWQARAQRHLPSFGLQLNGAFLLVAATFAGGGAGAGAGAGGGGGMPQLHGLAVATGRG